MITTSEYAVTITIWILALAGTFFGGRAFWRRRRHRRPGTGECAARNSAAADKPEAQPRRE